MSHLSDLIEEHCPNGVETFEKIGDFLEYEQPTKYLVKDTNYSDQYETPVLTAGQTFILGYTNETEGIYPASKYNPVIIFDDFTTAVQWVDFPFKAKSSAMKILKAREGIDCEIRYLYHLMQTIKFTPEGHKRHWIGIYSQIEIPLPPLPVQREIVKILDNFTELTAELTAELTLRKKQYAYYRDKLLSFEGEDVEWVTLGEVGEIKMCKRVFKDQTSKTGDIPFYKIGTFGGTPDAYISRELFEEYSEKYSYPLKGELLLSCSGTLGRVVEFDGEPAYFQDSNIVWLSHDESRIKNSFLKYVYASINWTGETGGTISRLYGRNIKSQKIPLPPLEEQQRIVDILDKFDSLVNDLNSGIPAEIEGRKKQYEYYREKLLSF